jgi:acetoin utilization protein AcuB
MLVSDAMTRHPIMISKETSASEARRIMTENNIRHLPVASSGKILEGLVTRQSFSLEPEMVGSLDVWDISRFLSGLNVANIMIKADMVHTIGADKTIERAARTMSEHKVGSLPVIEDGVVVGILTDVDVLNAIQNMLGMPEEGIRVTIRMPDRPGEFVKLTTVMGENKMGVVGIGTFRSPRRDGYYDMVVKICDVSKENVTAALSKIPDQEIIDIRTVV